MAVYAGIRAISLALAWFLLPRGRFAARHWSFTQWITTGDWGHYQAIAERGYTYHPGQLALDATFAWYPGYPGVVDAIAWLPGLGTDRAAFVVTVVAGLVAAWGLATLGMKLTASARASVLLVAFWAAAPGSLVLSMLYSEALFCALAVWTLVALVDRRWLTAGLLSAAAGTVHSTGMALVVAVGVAVFFRGVQTNPPDPPPATLPAVTASPGRPLWSVGDVAGVKERGARFARRGATVRCGRRIGWRPLAAVLIAPLGLLGYWGYVAWVSGRLDGWFWIERQTCHIYFDAGRGTLRLGWNAIMNGPATPIALILLLLAAAIALIGWSYAERLPAALNAYTIAIVVIAIGVSANWVGAKPRLLLPAVLLGLPLARLLAPLRGWLLWPLVVLMAAASTWFGLYLLVIARWAP